jgi:heat shock protein 5
LDEFIASSLAYRLDLAPGEANVVVFDLGNTLDVSVLSADQGIFEVLATSHRDIGGREFSQRVLD